MADFDFISIVLPTILAISASFIIMFVSKTSKAADGTLSGTIKLEHVQTGLTGLENRMNDRFERVEELITNKDTETRQSFQKVWDRLEKIEMETKLHSFRLDQIDKHQQKGNNHNG